jgi:hypothetical protein
MWERTWANHRKMRGPGLFGLVVVVLVAAQCPVWAVPDLQLYVEGATWDAATETWVTTLSEFDIQVIGANNVVADVKLAAALPDGTDPASGTVTLDPIGYGPQTAWQYGIPVMGDGSSLPPHGIYPTWYTTLPVGDLTPTYTVYDMQPGETGSALGEVRTVHVTITGFSEVHFDSYDHTVIGKQKIRKAPFSHDAGHAPEPGTIALFVSGMALMGGVRRMNTRRR